MKIRNIRAVTNGFIVQTSNGEEYVTKTLTEAAVLAGEPLIFTDGTHASRVVYSEGYSYKDLRNVKELAMLGNKIGAIKEIRKCFAGGLGLMEAKNIIEELC
mgnify:CR=1 FL=1|jgi:ribosomal protein L7/L12